jgi:hypothetical protein
MKIEIKSDWWTVIALLILAIFLIMFARLSLKITEYNNEFTYKMEQLKDINIKWIYKCDKFETNFYNCPNQFVNLTGQYCNQTLICKNIYEVKG